MPIVVKDLKKWNTMDQYLKIINDFKIIPDEEYAEIILFSFNNKKVRAKRINDQLCMNEKQFATYLNVPYGTVKSSFSRNNLKEEEHYFRIRLQNATYVFLTLLGILKLLKHIRKGYAEQFYDELSRYMYKNMNPVSISEFLLINKKRILQLQYLGDPKREWVADDGDILESRGEQIVDNILLKLKIPHQPKPRIFLPPKLEKKFNRKYPLIPDWNLKMIPRTIIEYWGRNDPEYIKIKKWKQEMYKALKLEIINIEPTEVQNTPKLTKKIMDKLKLK